MHPTRIVRFLIFLLGLALGIAATLAVVVFSPARTVSPPRPLPEDAPISVTFGDRFLTSLVRHADLPAPPGVTIERSELRVRLRDHDLVVLAGLTVLGSPVQATVTLRPVLRDDRLAIEVVATDLGTMPLPIERVLEDQINGRLAWLLDGIPVTVTGVAVERGRGLTVTCEVDVEQLAELR